MRGQVETYSYKVFLYILKNEGIELKHCPTERMIADYFTKPLQGKLFKKIRDIQKYFCIAITFRPCLICVFVTFSGLKVTRKTFSEKPFSSFYEKVFLRNTLNKVMNIVLRLPISYNNL